MIFTAFQSAGGETEVKGHAIDVDIWKKGFYPTYTLAIDFVFFDESWPNEVK